MTNERSRLRAVQMLLLATACWGLSFPGMKALALVQQPLVPTASSWFIASLSLVYRFGAASVLLWFFCRGSLHRLSRLEIKEGVGLGVFAAAGLIFQMDGLAYTSASTSAFLTQFYCVLIPIILAVRERKWPSGLVVLSVALVLTGVAILSKFDWQTFGIGRGEWETLAGSTIFTGQILWLQRREFAENNVMHFTLVMFIAITLVSVPVAVLNTPHAGQWISAYANAPSLILMSVLVVFCTLGGYGLMNRWQPLVTATQAGLIYCVEPMFASLFALFLPAWVSSWSGISYPNESLELNLLLGGGLITVANVLIQLPPAPRALPLSADDA